MELVSRWQRFTSSLRETPGEGGFLSRLLRYHSADQMSDYGNESRAARAGAVIASERGDSPMKSTLFNETGT